MKAGIITFHWGTNHGAILQAYALMKSLEKLPEFENVEIINYFPQNHRTNIGNAFKELLKGHGIRAFKQLLKEKRLNKFRILKLKLTELFNTYDELCKNPPCEDVIFCGSDQIWNPYYLLYGENQINPVYFAGFEPEECGRIALSVSFGCDSYPPEAMKVAKPYIEKFNAISVREKSGLKILKNIGVKNAVLLADPTVLLNKDEYLGLCKTVPLCNKPYIAVCMLRNSRNGFRDILKLIEKKISCYCKKKIENLSMELWLAGIRDSETVVTNSFHCVMICLKFHKPFVALKENGSLSGMNDRFFSLLEPLGLSNRVISSVSDIDDSFFNKDINWSLVDDVMREKADELNLFINHSVASIQGKESNGKI